MYLAVSVCRATGPAVGVTYIVRLSEIDTRRVLCTVVGLYNRGWACRVRGLRPGAGLCGPWARPRTTAHPGAVAFRFRVPAAGPASRPRFPGCGSATRLLVAGAARPYYFRGVPVRSGVYPQSGRCRTSTRRASTRSPERDAGGPRSLRSTHDRASVTSVARVIHARPAKYAWGFDLGVTPSPRVSAACLLLGDANSITYSIRYSYAVFV